MNTQAHAYNEQAQVFVFAEGAEKCHVEIG
jgi:hypothetical protein